MANEQIIDKLRQYAKLVKSKMPAKYLILFGSYAKGTESPESDIDVAIIVEKYPDRLIDIEIELCRLRRNIDLRIEPILLSEDDDVGFFDEIRSYGIKI